jgi:hypothetical protein
MNAPSSSESTALAVASSASAGALLLHEASMDRLERLADLMATGKTTVPQHLRGSKGDCFAIALQSMQWGMNPFAVAQKTHLVNGTLGYEAQLVAAVINNSGVVKDRFNFEWYGPWERVIGKFQIRKGEKGEYRVPGWTMADEEGCGIKVWATLKGENHPRVLDLLLAQARVRNSTLWADDPKQQLAYLAQKRWSRLYAPDVILGVYTSDELAEPGEKFMGPADEVGGAGADGGEGAAAAAPGKQTVVLPAFTEEDLTKRADKVRDFYAKGKDADTIIAFYAAKFTVPDAMKQRIRDMAPQQAATEPPADPATDVAPKVTYAALATRLQKCADADTAALIVDEGRALPADQQADLAKLFATQFPKE